MLFVSLFIIVVLGLVFELASRLVAFALLWIAPILVALAAMQIALTLHPDDPGRVFFCLCVRRLRHAVDDRLSRRRRREIDAMIPRQASALVPLVAACGPALKASVQCAHHGRTIDPLLRGCAARATSHRVGGGGKTAH